MSTSEPAKKTAKKTAKKVPADRKAPAKKTAKKVAKKAPTKKAAKQTVTARLTPEATEALGTEPPVEPPVEPPTDAELEQLADEARRSSLPGIIGTCTVSLTQPVDRAVDPVDAVNQFIDRIVDQGLRTWTYIVRDEATGEIHVVNRDDVDSFDGDGA